MATIIQSPDTLSFSRNLKEIIISSDVKTNFVLKKGEKILIEESYWPDADNRISIDVRTVVESELHLIFPTADITVQSGLTGEFTFEINDGFWPKPAPESFMVILGGVERMSGSVTDFLAYNFLTWQPQVKEVTYTQPEWLTLGSHYVNSVLLVIFYHTDGSTSSVIVARAGVDYAAGDIVTVNMQFARIWALGSGDRYGYFDVFAVTGMGGGYVTYTQRYILSRPSALDQYYCCANSLGGIDTFRFTGDLKFTPQIENSSVLLGDVLTADNPDTARVWSQNTGMLGSQQRPWVWELFRSSQVWHLRQGTMIPVVLKSSTLEDSKVEGLCSWSFEYSLSEDDGLLNIPRTADLPENIEIPAPDGGLFFLAPRLIEYPDAALDDSWLIPLQSGYEEKWYKISVGGLTRYILKEISSGGTFDAEPIPDATIDEICKL